MKHVSWSQFFTFFPQNFISHLFFSFRILGASDFKFSYCFLQIYSPQSRAPPTRDFLFSLVPGFSERIHPGIFWSQNNQMITRLLKSNGPYLRPSKSSQDPVVVMKFEFCAHSARLLRKLDHVLFWILSTNTGLWQCSIILKSFPERTPIFFTLYRR